MSRAQKIRQIWMLTGLVALVVGYAIYDFKSDEKITKEKEEASYLIPLKPEQISGLKIKNKAGEVEVTRNKDGWMMTVPLKELADSTAIDNYLSAVVDEKSTDVVLEKDKIDWSQFGLDQPRGILTLKDNAGKETTIAVGNIKNFQGDAFLRRNNEMRVLIGANTWFVRIDQNLTDFRDKRIFRGSLMGIRGVALNGYHLIRKNDTWIATEHPDYHLDQNKVRELLSMLNQTSGLEVIAEGKIKPKEEADWGFKKPSVSISLQYEDGKKWHAEFAQANKITRVRTSDPEVTLKIAPSDMGKFLSADLDSLRDKAEPFQFDRSAVAEVEISLPAEKLKEKLKFKLQNQEWISEGQAGHVDQDKLKATFIRIHGDLAIEFVKDQLEPTGFVTLHDKNGKEIFSLQWGNLQKRKYDGIDNSVYLAKTSLSPETFTILASDIDNLKLDQILLKEGSH